MLYLKQGGTASPKSGQPPDNRQAGCPPSVTGWKPILRSIKISGLSAAAVQWGHILTFDFGLGQAFHFGLELGAFAGTAFAVAALDGDVDFQVERGSGHAHCQQGRDLESCASGVPGGEPADFRK